MPGRGRPSRNAIFGRLNQAMADLHSTVGGLPLPIEGEEIWEGIWYEETHNSTALEGNTLILKEVRMLLDTGRVVGEKEFREYLEVQGYGEAAKWVYSRAYEVGVHDSEGNIGPLITLTELREIHRLTVEPVWRHFPPDDHDSLEGPGSFRRHDIEPFASGMRPPPWPDVPPQINDWIDKANAMIPYYDDWLDAQPRPDTDASAHPIARLADIHAHFERIHPFRDGNGRAGRLALNLLLVRMLYPPAIILKRDRTKYLRALERADKQDPLPLGELLARALTNGIDRFLLPNLAGPQRLIRLSALADADLSLIALRRAAERGRLRAQRRSDQWYSTRKWVNEYKASRRRGRSPDTSMPPARLRRIENRDGQDSPESPRLF